MDAREDGSPRSAATAKLDEVAATEARLHYRTEGVSPLGSDGGIGQLLARDERVFAVRREALLHRRTSPEGPVDPPGLAGDLYLTSARLILVGERVLTFDLEDIREAVLAGEQLLLVMGDGIGLSLAVVQPRLLRVQIAAMRAIARAP